MQAHVQAVSDAEAHGAACVSITVEDSIGVLEQGNQWKFARSGSEGVKDGVGPCRSDLVECTARQPRPCCTIELAVGRLYEARCRVSPIPKGEIVEHLVNSGWGYLINDAIAARPAEFGCAIEVSVTGLNDRTVRMTPVYVGKVVQHGELAHRGHLEDHATSSITYAGVAE